MSFDFNKQSTVSELCAFIDTPKLTTKASKCLTYTLDYFIINYCSNRNGLSFKSMFVEEYNSILMSLCLNDVITLSDNTNENGIKTILDINDPFKLLCEDKTLTIFNRKGYDVDYTIDLRNTNEAFETLMTPLNKVPFDTYVSLKMLHKQVQCAKRGIEFSLSFADMKRLLSRKKCYYSGIEMTMEGKHSLSLDRIDDKKGYEPSNVVACSSYVNGLKNELLEGRDRTRELSNGELKKVLSKFIELL
ncbi:Uncharacterised protein [Acinetobacter phage MD-2021a]|nr:Uncharacterised protein [Acinetobacter phage MD-2021a]CAH1089007.1 Uncharacterised protein [Acinetobacter phage MD-2021a]